MDKDDTPHDHVVNSDRMDDSSLPIANAQATVVRIDCRSQVPSSEAVNPEAEDYVVNFCGLDYYERLRKLFTAKS